MGGISIHRPLLTFFKYAALALTLLLAVTACSPAASAPGTPQVLRLNLSGEPSTLDPARASWSGEVAVIRQVFQGLLGFNPDLTLRPVVAQEVPSATNGGISPDGRTLIFRLRQGVKWSDGEPVTARDFEYGLKRLLDPAIGARYASFYYAIAGAREYNAAKDADDAAKAALRDRVGVRALDDRTLEIRLAEPRYSFLHLMALWSAYPVRRDMIEKYGDKWIEPATYIGNGPFRMTEWAHQDHITLEANVNYWGTRPKLDKLILKMVKDENVAYVSYLKGELELAAVPAGNEKAVMEDGTLRQQIVRYNALSTFALQFNVKVAPFDNKKLRQAIALAVDRDSFIAKVRSGIGRPAYSWVPPGMPGHDPALGKQYAFNPSQARQLLAEAGYPEGKGLPAIKFQYSDVGANKTIAEFLQAQLKENLGIPLVLEPMESKAFSQMVNQRKHTWAFFGWNADYPDPDNWLSEIFASGSRLNSTGYSNPRFDELVPRAKAETEPQKRLALWSEAQRMMVDDAPAVFLFHRERFFLKKPYVLGLTTTGMDGLIPGDFFLGQVSITPH